MTDTIQRVSNVTQDNIFQKVKDYAQLNRGCIIITPKDNPQSWGAWKAYRLNKGLRVQLMERDEREWAEYGRGNLMTVPCLMPSDFDDGWEWANDHAAGDRFMENYKRFRA